ncbi:MAG: transporter substrate-binding domain-containing protein [Lachnospiraceae bacterium]|nr:transporter substrate-binding domain-containing protein [Lachnospiraceae bacterium]
MQMNTGYLHFKQKAVGFSARRLLCIAIMMLILLSVMPVFCYGESDTQTVRVAVVDYPNYIEMNKDGTVSGYAYDYLQDIRKYTGWRYEFQEMSFAEAVRALESGNIDLLAGNQYTKERAELFDYSAQDMGNGGSVLCVRLDDMRYCYNDYASYDGMKIAVLAGSVRMEQARKILTRFGAEVDFIAYDTDQESKTALEKGEVDAVLMSTIRCEAKYKILARLSTDPLYFCLNKQRPQLKTQLDDAMIKLHLDSPYYEEKLDEKCYGNVPVQLAFTQAEKRYIARADTITVAVSDDLIPLEYYSEKEDSYKGVTLDSLDLIAQYSGLKFQFVTRSDTDTLKNQLRTGKVQLVASVAEQSSPAEQWGVELTNAYRDNSISLVINDSVSDYKNTACQLVLRQGYPYLEQMAKEEGYTNIVYADSYEECVRMVSKKTADLAMIPTNCADSLIHMYSYDDLSTYLLPDSDVNFCIGVSPISSPMLLSILNKSIATITKEQRTEMLVQNLSAVNETFTMQHYITSHRVTILIAALGVSVLFVMGACYFAVSRQRTNRQLAIALKEADSANAAKSDFLARMSHDIRTPMNAIIGLTHLAKEEENIRVVHQYLRNIAASSDFLLGLINDILDMSKIESGDLELKLEPYELAEFEKAVNTVIKPLMDEKKIEFVLQMKSTAQCVLTDCLRFNQIFFNLLSNAAKFTQRGGKVEFLSRDIPPKEGVYGVRYTVRDNGIGMSKEFLPHIFESFSQEVRDENVKEIGTGLGLPIVKSLVDAMGGTILVKSELGQGTEYTIDLYTPLTSKGQSRTEIKQEKSCLAGAELLLVEDNDMNILVAQRLLEKEGAHVTVAHNGKEAVIRFEMEEKNHFDAILMDIRMPVMDGITAAKKIRQADREDARLVPIIAMTADAFTEEQQKTLEAGMNAHLTKPIDPTSLYQTLLWLMEKNKGK